MPELPIGSPIPGSKYFRAYCNSCNEPIRVTAASLGRLPGHGTKRRHFCHRCCPIAEPKNELTTHQRAAGVNRGQAELAKNMKDWKRIV